MGSAGRDREEVGGEAEAVAAESPAPRKRPKPRFYNPAVTNWQDGFAIMRYGRDSLDDMYLQGMDHPKVREFFDAVQGIKRERRR